MGRRKVLEIGAVILLSILINWLLLIWILLVCYSYKTRFINECGNNSTTTIVNKIFYGLYLCRLGRHRTRNFWDILTAILSFTGLILISIAITYLIPVVSAEITKRKISVNINTLGGSVEEILLNYWNGSHFKEIEQPFIPLIDLLYYMHKIISTLFCIFFIPQIRKRHLYSISPI
jgi:hypothetical protein